MCVWQVASWWAADLSGANSAAVWEAMCQCEVLLCCVSVWEKICSGAIFVAYGLYAH